MSLGGGPGSFERLHELFASAFLPSTSILSTNFLREVERLQPFDTNPIYALLHESIYLDGSGVSSSWAAGRALQEDPELSKMFDYTATMDVKHEEPVLFFGEMVYAFMFEVRMRRIYIFIYNPNTSKPPPLKTTPTLSLLLFPPLRTMLSLLP